MDYVFTKPKRSVQRVFVHCSASDNPKHDNVRTMRAWHKARGWSDVGYHYFIRKDGTLELGRPISRTPAAQGGRKNIRKNARTKPGNKGTIAICCHGLAKEKFTEAQFKTLRALCGQINQAYNGRVTFHGHREVAHKECPVFDYKGVLGLDANGRMVGRPDKSIGAAAPKPAEPAKPRERTIDDVNDVMRFGDEGWFVQKLQEELKEKLYSPGRIDGHFGKHTRDAVAKLKLHNGMDTADQSMPITLQQARDAKPNESPRQNMTMDQLRKEGSSEVKNADLGQRLTEAGGVVGAGTAVVKGMPDGEGQSLTDQAKELVEKGEEATGLAERAKGLFDGIGDGAVSNGEAIIMIAVGCAIAWFLFQRAKNRRLKAAQELRNI